MKTIAMSLIVGLSVASPAFAAQCPADMAAIDAALQTAQLGAQEEARVRQLRADGEALHQAGQHQESIERLAEAKAILNIE